MTDTLTPDIEHTILTPPCDVTRGRGRLAAFFTRDMSGRIDSVGHGLTGLTDRVIYNWPADKMTFLGHPHPKP